MRSRARTHHSSRRSATPDVRYLTVDEVIAVFAAVIGRPVMRYPDGVSSAVGRPQQTVFGEDAYPTVAQKAAALMQSLAQNQPFVDGNKRIAWICGKLFLQLNGWTMHATDAEALDLFTNRVASGLTVDELAEWIVEHMSPFPQPIA